MSIDVTHPHLSAQWHNEKNGDLKPNMVTHGMRKKVWWKCEKMCSHGCIHEWEEQIRVRKKNGCPFCAKHRICIHDSIAFTNPSVANEWHPTKNGSLKPTDIPSGTIKKVWWLCKNTNCTEKCPHEWEANVHSRCGKDQVGCPYCSIGGVKRVCIHNSIVHTHPHIAKQWHPTKNNTLLPEQFSSKSKIKVWWRCPRTCNFGCVHDFQARIWQKIKTGEGCPYCCYATRKVCQHTSLAFTHPELVSEWNTTKNYPLTPETVSRGCQKKAWWKCKNNHDYSAKISNRTLLNQSCPVCKNKTEQKLFEYLQSHFSTVIAQFRLDTCKNKRHLPFDFCIPEHKAIIELDGNQHFSQVANWLSPEQSFQNDIFKMKKAIEAGFKIIRIYQPDVYTSSTEWLNNELLISIPSAFQVKYISKRNDIYTNHSLLFDSPT